MYLITQNKQKTQLYSFLTLCLIQNEKKKKMHQNKNDI